MKQDVNKIINTLNAEWAQDLSSAKRKLAVAVEKNRLLKAEVDRLNSELETKSNKGDEQVEYPNN